MSTNHKKAKKDYLKGMKYKEISEKYEVSINTVKSWKQRYEWKRNKGSPTKKGVHTKSKSVHTKKGGQPGNQNAVGNAGGAGGPPMNGKAVTHGLFRKYLPDNEEYREIYDAAGETNSLDMLWTQIQLKFANIIHAQKVMFVESKEEMIKELKKRKFEIHNTGSKKEPVFEKFMTEEEYEFQFAWDRQATLLNSQSRAMGQLSSMIRQYEEMCRLGWADDEQKIRVEKLKSEVKLLEQKATQDVDKPIEILISRKGERS